MSSRHLRHKTLVFVTNRLEFVNSCDRIVVLKEGQIAADGSYAALMEQSSVFRSIMADQGGGTGTGSPEQASVASGSIQVCLPCPTSVAVSLPEGIESII